MKIKHYPPAETESASSASSSAADSEKQAIQDKAAEIFGEKEQSEEKKELLSPETPFGKKAESDFMGSPIKEEILEEELKKTDNPLDLTVANSKKPYIAILIAVVLIHLAFALFIDASNKKPNFDNETVQAENSLKPALLPSAPAPKLPEFVAEKQDGVKQETTADRIASAPKIELPSAPQAAKLPEPRNYGEIEPSAGEKLKALEHTRPLVTRSPESIKETKETQAEIKAVEKPAELTASKDKETAKIPEKLSEKTLELKPQSQSAAVPASSVNEAEILKILNKTN